MSNSSNTAPTFFVAIIAGASLGLIDTARILPTSSSCGTTIFSATISAIQARMIGTASTRSVRGSQGRFVAVCALMPTSPRRRSGR